MSRRSFVLLAAAALVYFAPARLNGQATPRTGDGRPAFAGIWTNSTLTPFERPKEFAGKEFFTPKEAADYSRRMQEQNNRDRRGATPQDDVNLAYNEAWFDRGTKVYSNLRTSIVVDPADGRVPALTPEARDAAAARAAVQSRRPEGPEDFPVAVRCLLFANAGPPMVSTAYNNNYAIVQTRGYVGIDVEMIHDMRIIPLSGRPHISSSIRLWMGDSVGHWDGDTLVVDTTNFTDKTHVRGSDQNLHLIERFKLMNANTIRYRFTVG
jgi:hypothetical protein